uniref:Uncharacterized protein n=1 Tax=Romanomermis culicivorax TaxID=13658 RepID=A0A915J491_ROMCU
MSLTVVQKSGLFSSLLCPSQNDAKCYLIQGVTDSDNQWKLDLDKGGYAYELENKPDLTTILGSPSATEFINDNVPKSRHLWNILLGLYDTADPTIADLNFTKVLKRDLQSSGVSPAKSNIDIPDAKLAKVSRIFAYKADGRGNFEDLINVASRPRSHRVVKNDHQIGACKATNEATKCSSYEACVNGVVKHISCLVLP